MDTTDPKDAGGAHPEGEPAEPSVTLFGYSRRCEEPTDAEGADVDPASRE